MTKRTKASSTIQMRLMPSSMLSFLYSQAEMAAEAAIIKIKYPKGYSVINSICAPSSLNSVYTPVLRQHPAIYIDHLPGDVAGHIGSQE